MKIYKMADNAFLDKSIILGYVFLSDPHHIVCREYIDTEETDFYATQEVMDIYHRRRENFIKEHQEAVLRHTQYVTRNFEGELTTRDIDEIRANIDRMTNPAWRYLEDFYSGRVGDSTYSVTKNLRDTIRDLERRADSRHKSITDRIFGWIRFSTYSELQEQLQILVDRGEEEDVRIILDAHDVASYVDGSTELTTANPKDFDDPEVKAVIDEHTNIDHIELVFVSRDYEPL